MKSVEVKAFSMAPIVFMVTHHVNISDYLWYIVSLFDERFSALASFYEMI